jgi:hypothetical protein
VLAEVCPVRLLDALSHNRFHLAVCEARACGRATQSVGELVDNTERMRHALNEDWRRRSLGWMTAAEKWATRVVPRDDRADLRAAVAERAARLRRNQHLRGRLDDLLVERLAIEQTLTQRGYLRQQPGGRC